MSLVTRASSGPVHLLGFDEHLLWATLVVATLVTGALLAVAVVGFVRRRSWPYLLVTVALATLVVRPVFGVLTLGGVLGQTTHHILEHGLDVLAVALLVGAIALARSADRRRGGIRE